MHQNRPPHSAKVDEKKEIILTPQSVMQQTPFEQKQEDLATGKVNYDLEGVGLSCMRKQFHVSLAVPGSSSYFLRSSDVFF